MTHPRTTARASRRPAADRPWPKPLISANTLFVGYVLAVLALAVVGLSLGLGMWLGR